MVWDFSLQGWNNKAETFRLGGEDIAEALGKALAAYEEIHGEDPVALGCHPVIE